MNIEEVKNRGLFKFTGPPENWITAIKYMTWGLTPSYENRWLEIEPGDIFLLHSMSTDTIVKDAKSAVIGFGVVGTGISKKNNLLWLKEHQERENIWPLLVPFSEVYLFSPIVSHEGLEAPDGTNNEKINEEAQQLLIDAVPLASINSFPQMGSTSSVKPEVVAQIFDLAGKFYLYRSVDSSTELVDTVIKPLPLKRIESARDTLRKPASLSDLEVVKKKNISAGQVTYAKDNQLLERAEDAHYQTLDKLVKLLRSKGYDTYSNRYVDLFATNKSGSYLFEVKSIENHNFRSQARKGIVQLFEYEYFEVRKFFEENSQIETIHKSLVVSKSPSDEKYVEFINNLKLEVGYFSGDSLTSYGASLGLANI